MGREDVGKRFNATLLGREFLQGAEGQRALWCAVLFRALSDATAPDYGCSSDERAARASARSWIGCRDFYEVCRLAGMEPEYILDGYRSGRINEDDIRVRGRRGPKVKEAAA